MWYFVHIIIKIFDKKYYITMFYWDIISKNILTFIAIAGRMDMFVMVANTTVVHIDQIKNILMWYENEPGFLFDWQNELRFYHANSQGHILQKDTFSMTEHCFIFDLNNFMVLLLNVMCLSELQQIPMFKSLVKTG